VGHPPDANAAFVAAMEDILDVYQRPHDPECPMVCVDETSKQLIAETRVPIAAKPGRAARYDYEYRRNGTANLFMMFAPLEGWRHVKVTDRHTALDYAQVLKECPIRTSLTRRKSCSSRIISTRTNPRRFTERFSRRGTAARGTVRVALHAKHGSWLDMAESELGVLSFQCLDRRIPDQQMLKEEVDAWEADRNKKHAEATGGFTTENARVKLKRLYPAL